MSAGRPWMCTGMMALVRVVMAASILRAIHAVGARVNVDEHRDGVLVQGARRGGQEREGGGDDLIARADAAGRQRHVQRGRAAAGGQAVLAADVGGPFFLKPGNHGRGAAGHDAAVEHLVDELAVVGGDDRPVAVVAALHDGLSAGNGESRSFTV